MRYLCGSIFMILIYFSIICNAQTSSKTDSLLAVLKVSKVDTNKVNTLLALSLECYNNFDYANEMLYANEALSLSEKLKWQKGKAAALYRTGIAYDDMSKYDDALKNYLASLKIYKTLNDKEGMGNVYRNIGLAYYHKGIHPEALKYYFSALKAREEINDKPGIADLYYTIGTVYHMQEDTINALKNYLSALKVRKSIGDAEEIAKSYNSIGRYYVENKNFAEAMIYYNEALRIREPLGNKRAIANSYNNIAIVYNHLKNYSESLKYHNAALKLRQAIDDKKGIANSYDNIATVHADQHNYSQAMKFYFLALEIRESYFADNKQEMILLYNNIAQTYYEQYKFRSAKKWHQKGLVLAKEMEDNWNIQNSYNFLAEIDVLLNDYKGAYYNYKQYTIYKDSVFNEENTKKLAEIQMQYDFDKKQAATKAEQDKKDAIAASELKRKSLQRNASAAGLVLMLLLATVFFTQRNRINKEKQRSDALLLNILPSEVAEELKEHGESEAKYFDEVSVLFTDFVDFTSISESLMPKELVNELHTCFKAFDEIITRHGLEKIKTIGDAYMAVCGLPLANVQHAQNTVKAAQEIIEFIQKRKEENANGFDIRIGINSGSVVAGIVGVKKFSYDIWGDTVNAAARMESHGMAGRINISGSTYELIKSDFTCEYRGKIHAKGKGEVDMYFIN